MYKLITQRKKEFLIVRLCNQIRETRSKTNKKGEGGKKKKKIICHFIEVNTGS